MVLLTDDEILQVWGVDGSSVGDLYINPDDRKLLKAQLKKVLTEAKTEDLSVKFRKLLEKEAGL